MRPIFFRGKRIDNGEWVYGMPCATELSGIYAIQTLAEGWIFDIVPETIGQYTGLIDKNGKKIYEGDIGKGFLRIHLDRTIYQVVYEGNGFYYYDEDGVTWHPDNIDNFEIIGNVHDNPELLKGGAER